MAAVKHSQNTARKTARRIEKLKNQAPTEPSKRQTKWLRCNHIIRELEYTDQFNDQGEKTSSKLTGHNDTHFTSISAAKRKSRELQQSSGQLGDGQLKLVPKLPKTK